MERPEDIFKEPWFVKQLMDAGLYENGIVAYTRIDRIRENTISHSTKKANSKWNKRTLYLLFREMCYIVDNKINAIDLPYEVICSIEKASAEYAPDEKILKR